MSRARSLPAPSRPRPTRGAGGDAAPARPAAGEHVVQLYRDSRQLARSVARFTADAVEGGAAVLLLLTPVHRRLAEHALRREGLPIEELLRREQVVIADAEATLRAVLAGDEVPDRARFHELIGGMLGRARGRFSAVAVCSELVELLRRRSPPSPGAEQRLEELWREAVEGQPIRLLAVYRATAGGGRPQPIEAARSGARVVRDLSSRERLLGAASELFSTSGFDTTTTAAIARRAGTSESQLVKHFASKDGLLQAVLEDWWGRFFVGVEATRAGGRPPVERLLQVFDLLLEGLRSDPAAARLLLFEGRRLRQPDRGFATSDGFRRLTATLDGILAGLASEGRLASGLSVQTVRAALIGAFEGLARSPVLASLTERPAAYGLDEVRSSFRALVHALLATEPG